MVKWKRELSEQFEIQQGVRQGGILSTDMYKVFLNHLLYRMCVTNLGAPATADDLTSDSKSALQTLVSTSDDYSCMEHYLLQPVKSVVMHYPGSKKSSTEDSDSCWTINGEAMPLGKETTHMGILRSSASDNVPVFENTKRDEDFTAGCLPVFVWSVSFFVHLFVCFVRVSFCHFLFLLVSGVGCGL